MNKKYDDETIDRWERDFEGGVCIDYRPDVTPEQLAADRKKKLAAIEARRKEREKQCTTKKQ